MSVPMVVQVGLMLATAPVADIAAAFGTQLDADAEKTIQQIGTLINLLKALPVLCELAGSPKYKFVTPVAPQFLRCKLDDLSGDATIFATLDKKIAGREKWNMLDALGLGSLPRETRRDFERSVGKDSTLRDFTVSAPAAVLAPVAIFR